MIQLFKDPHGETALDHVSTGDVNVTLAAMKQTFATTTEATSNADETAVLRQRITELEKKLSEVRTDGVIYIPACCSCTILTIHRLARWRKSKALTRLKVVFNHRTV
jgi:hypothetical protein